MAADYALLEQAIAIISSVRGLYMDPDALADESRTSTSSARRPTITPLPAFARSAE